MRKYARVYGGAPGVVSIINAGHEDHSRLRRSLAHGFSDSALRQQEPLLQTHTDLLVKRLHEHSNNGEASLDLCAWFNWITFDIVGLLTFGETFGCLNNTTNHPWMTIILGYMRVNVCIQAATYLPFGSMLVSMLVPKKLLAKRAAHFQLVHEMVKRRLEIKEDRPDFYSNILRRDEWTYMELTVNAATLVVAGSETTATACSAITYYLLRNPIWIDKLVQEIRTSYQRVEEITISSTANLKCLTACITEGLRMMPPAPVGFPREVPPEGGVILGKHIPAGVSCYEFYETLTNSHRLS